MFPCTQCGLCCQNISQIKELKDYDLGNGVCKYFDYANNSCKIYENRPNICQIDKMFDIEYHKNFTKKEFYIENAKVCNYLQKIANIDLSYRIKLEE
jgi:Fe-S-cluster containining protein